MTRTSGDGASNLRIISGSPSRPPARGRRRHRFHRRHTPHFYLVSSGLTGAVLVCLLDAVALHARSVILAEIAFAAVVCTALIIFTGFFWGFYMVANGTIRTSKLHYLIPHAAVGMLSPLLYTLNVSIGLDGLGRPLGVWSLICGCACLALLLVQYAMGRAVVRPVPIHVVPRARAG